MSITKQLSEIQTTLNAPKNLHNKFGGYNYRSAEGILEAVKPLLKTHGLTLVVSDEVELIGDRIYVKATATVKNAEGEQESSSAFAREADSKKGMDEAQITGSASSYARKYALNGLFCIDDGQDPDSQNKHGKDEASTKTSPAPSPEPTPRKKLPFTPRKAAYQTKTGYNKK